MPQNTSELAFRCLLCYTKSMVNVSLSRLARSFFRQNVSKNDLGMALGITYIVAMAAVPFLDYRGSLFFAILGLYFASPFVLISVLLCVVLFYTGIRAAVCFGKGDYLSAVGLFALSLGLAACNGLLIRYVHTSLLGPSPPRWFTHGMLYHTLASGASVLVVPILAGLLLGVPLASLCIGTINLNQKKLSGLKYLTVAAAGFAAFGVASRANDLLTVASCTPGIQAALSAAHSYGPLPQMSRSFPFGVLDRDFDIAVCMLNGPLFDAQYIAHDSVDVSTADASDRLSRLLDRGQCHVRTRQVVSGFYWISEAC
jgi:hypothetical protein